MRKDNGERQALTVFWLTMLPIAILIIWALVETAQK